MKILAVADQPSDYLWGPGVAQGLDGVDLILSCGDLNPRYLEYLVTFSQAPLLYVHGNHDGRCGQSSPEGCVCVDGRLTVCKGLRILGLGGSIRYNRESAFQYTQSQMKRRAARLHLSICRHGGFDILLTHAGARGLGDGEDYAHAGFQAFNDLLERWQPPYFIHGHTHLNYDTRQKRTALYRNTQVINAFERYTFEVQEER